MVAQGIEHLRRMWDQDHYAMSFDWAGGYGPNTAYDSLHARLSRAHEPLRNQIHNLQSQWDYIDIAATAPTRQATPPPPSERSSPYVVVHGGTGVNVAIGSRVRGISMDVQAITGPSAEEVQRLTTAFAEALAAADDIPTADREEGLEQLKFVADAVSKPGTVHQAILRPIVERLGLIAVGSMAVYSIYQQWEPVISSTVQQFH